LKWLALGGSAFYSISGKPPEVTCSLAASRFLCEAFGDDKMLFGCNSVTFVVVLLSLTAAAAVKLSNGLDSISS